MQIIKPTELIFPRCLVQCFLCGPISSWRQRCYDELNKYSLNHLRIFDPTREDFDTLTEEQIKEQIFWEYYHLTHPNGHGILSVYIDDVPGQQFTFLELGRYTQLYPAQDQIISINSKYKNKNEIKYHLQFINSKIKVVERTPEEHAKEIVNMYGFIKRQMGG